MVPNSGGYWFSTFRKSQIYVSVLKTAIFVYQWNVKRKDRQVESIGAYVRTSPRGINYKNVAFGVD